MKKFIEEVKPRLFSFSTQKNVFRGMLWVPANFHFIFVVEFHRKPAVDEGDTDEGGGEAASAADDVEGVDGGLDQLFDEQQQPTKKRKLGKNAAVAFAIKAGTSYADFAEALYTVYLRRNKLGSGETGESDSG